jgi:hypothetical protein
VDFDNAPIHNSKRGTEKLIEKSQKRIPHPGYRPDRPPFDFVPFGYLKDKLTDKPHRNRAPEEPFSEVETIISEFPTHKIS